MALQTNSRKHCLFVGNPGVGKSTLLNCLMKDKVASNQLFKSGVSISKGMTYQLDTRVVDEITYMDTPGLEDVDRRKEAAEAITKALKTDGDYQVVFVVTLESGRIRPVDIATIRIVLENARGIQHYGVIFNKLTKPVYDRLTSDNKKDRSAVIAQVAFLEKQGKKPAPLFLMRREKLQDYENVVVQIPELETFMKQMPYLVVHKESVTDIPHDNTFNEYVKEQVIALEQGKKQLEYQMSLEENRRREEERKMEAQRENDRMAEEEARLRMEREMERERENRRRADEKIRLCMERERREREMRLQKERNRIAEEKARLDAERERQRILEDKKLQEIQRLQNEIDYSPSYHGCFDVSSIVIVKQSKREVEIGLGDLKEGDFVKTVNDEGEVEFSKVYYVAHANERKRSELLSIYYGESNGTVEKIGLSDRHLIYISEGGEDKFSATPVMAGQVKKGDYLWVLHGADIVAKPIFDVRKYMAYVVHPLTENHHIIVDDVHASVHIINENLYRILTYPLKWVCSMYPGYTHSNFINRAVRLVEDFKEPFAKMKIGNSLDAISRFALDNDHEKK